MKIILDIVVDLVCNIVPTHQPKLAAYTSGHRIKQNKPWQVKILQKSKTIQNTTSHGNETSKNKDGQNNNNTHNHLDNQYSEAKIGAQNKENLAAINSGNLIPPAIEYQNDQQAGHHACMHENNAQEYKALQQISLPIFQQSNAYATSVGEIKTRPCT